ncbi:MAG: carbohydrate binding family 9 domain-containing protein [Ignavibacteria bacterium]|nr:carbohydrate binding family 9 domain-containing protein [Ignavibacteria bacterium]
MNKTITLLSLAILTFLITDCFSQTTEFKDTSERIDTAEVSFKPNILPGLNVPKLNAGNMNIDGVLNEDVWNNAVTAENFTEISPGDNVKPEVETKVKIFYDDDYIYFGYTCYEKDMESVRASLSDRDRMYGDDWVGPFIDTYSDLKQGFEMYVNPKGIQGDLLWTSNSEDSNYDIIYDSEAKMYKDKWTAEMRIPFKSLRFPDRKEQKWRIHLLRNRPRGARQEIYWASVSRDNPNFMGQSGTLNGIKDVKRGRDIQILPYILGTQNSTLEDFSDPDSKYTHGKLEGEIGLSAKYGLSSTLTLDATYNPDFSQVEADAPQININSPFALFYPEKRPFFLEGIDHFATPINVSYTRSINNPLFAAKLSGKINKLDIGFISAYDENTPYIIPLTERSFFLSSNKNSVSNILRMKYDMGGENYLGFIFSDREQSADSSKAFGFTGFNRNYGFDGKFNFASNYYLTFQILQNNTKEINDTNFKYNSLKNFRFDDNKYTALLDGESYSGSNVYLSFNRNARNWSFYSEYFFQAPTVRRDNGFIQRNNFHQLFMQQEYNFYPEGKVLRRVNPELNMEIRYDAKGKLKEQFVELNLVTDWTNGLWFAAGYLPVNNEDYGGIFHKNINRWHFNMEANNLSKFISGGFYYEGGKFIVRFEDPTYVGFGHNLDIWATIKPFDRLRNDINYSYSELSKSAGGEKLFAGYVVSDKISYQFNKNFFLRVLLQYDLFSRNFTVDPLLSYKWNPYTILFLGSSHDISEISDNNGFGKYTETDRYFYLKFQYLWSL